MTVLFSAVAVVLRHPELWATALRQARVLARPGWWRRPPFLPVPDPDYLRFRLLTAYGGDGSLPSDGGELDADDLLTYLRWCRAFPQVTAT